MLMDELFWKKLIATRRESLVRSITALAGNLDEKTANMFAGALRELSKLEKERDLAIEKKRLKKAPPDNYAGA